jgi:AAA15 family ATPase/GTPase
MIEDIEINNFRCFDQLKVSGCKRINLISGKNNVGKTALLEAIFLSSMPTKDAIVSIGNLRNELFISVKESSEKMWSSFFYQQNINNISCSINTIFQDGTFKNIDILIDDEKYILARLDNSDRLDNSGLSEIVATYNKRMERDRLRNDDERYLGAIKINTSNSVFAIFISLSRNREVIFTTPPHESVNDLYIQNASFIPSNQRASSTKLTAEFDKARLDDRDDEVLRAFQLIDSSIVAVESFSIPEPTIYLKRQGEKRLPLSLFGDAMNRIADIILKIINNQDSVLLIDEIENGIHHSNQIAFWDFLYKLAEQLNVQIFATTHSLEMTEAFIKAGLERQDSAAHFELVRHEKTNKIVAINRDLETLEYGISHHKEVRGGA